MTREQAINYLICRGITEYRVSEIVRALTYEPTTKNDLGVDCISRDVVKNYIQAHIHEIITESGEDKNKHTNRVLRSLIHGVNCMPSVTPQLSVSEVTALAEWTEKLTKASEEAYRRGYLDCNEKLRAFQKLHDEERELKEKLNKIDIEDAWKCGFEQGVKHEKLASTNICPHCGEYIGEEE